MGFSTRVQHEGSARGFITTVHNDGSQRRFTPTVHWILALVIVYAATATAQKAVPLAAAIDALASRMYPPDGPAAAVIVTKAGTPIYRKAFGMADLELGVKAEPDMIFRIGSVTKQFTAAAVLLLAEDGKLSLDDDITRFVPDFPTHGKRITIEHLLTHTSGIKSYTGMPAWLSLRRKDLSVRELIDVFKNEPLEFDPGAKWVYSNSGYVLLGAIVEKASGMGYEQFLKERIFTPLGMTHTMYDDTGRIVPRRVPGYGGRGGQWTNAEFVSMTQPFSAGALISNVDDLARWSAALYSGRLLKPDSLRRMTTSYVLSTGRPTDYGYGLSLGEYAARHVFEHGGGIQGFTCHVVRANEDDVFVAVLTNVAADRPNPAALARRVAAIAIGKPIADPVPITLGEDALEPLVGAYQTDDKEPRTIVRTRATLYLRHPRDVDRELVPTSPTTFAVRDGFGRLTFERGPDGVVNAVTLESWTTKEHWTRVKLP